MVLDIPLTPRYPFRPLVLAACLLLLASVPAARAQAPDRYAAPDIAYQNKDYATALRLWLGLADDGNTSAYFNLGRMYLFGEGVTIDPLEAYKWFTLADMGGVPQAKAGLARLGPIMTTSDVTEARRRIERFYDSHPNLKR